MVVNSQNKLNRQEFVILIVDDILSNVKVLGQMLKSQGYSITFALSGKDALNIVKNAKPDLILLDLFMPEMDGLEVCKKIKQNPEWIDIPILFLTASNEERDLIEAFAQGAEDYITKPYSKSELLARVETHLKIKIQNQTLKEINQELETFNYAVSHDLKNLVAIFKGCVPILQYKYGSQLDDQAQNLLKIMNSTSLEMESLLVNLLRLSQLKQQKLELETVNLTQIAEKIIKSLQIQTPEKKVKFIIPPEIIVKCDVNLMMIALENLIGNAWKYSQKREESLIKLGVFNEDIDSETLNNILKPYNLYFRDKSNHRKPTLPIYYIQDNGVGFLLKKASNIFQPFQRLHNKSEFQGTGIGLSTVQRIIKAHNGLIWCESKPNQGSTFYFTLE